jgi:hypothetical protein
MKRSVAEKGPDYRTIRLFGVGRDRPQEEISALSP